MTPAEIRRIAELSIPHLEKICRHFAPGGEVVGDYYIAPVPNRPGYVVHVGLKTGSWQVYFRRFFPSNGSVQ